MESWSPDQGTRRGKTLLIWGNIQERCLQNPRKQQGDGLRENEQTMLKRKPWRSTFEDLPSLVKGLMNVWGVFHEEAESLIESVFPFVSRIWVSEDKMEEVRSKDRGGWSCAKGEYKVWRGLILEVDQDDTETDTRVTVLRGPWECYTLVTTNKNKNKTKRHCQPYNSP